MISLRTYQHDLIRDIRAAFVSGLKSVCAVGPTGMGKSLCFAEIAKHAHGRNKKTCIVVHRDTLLRQAAEKLDAFKIPYGIIAAGYSGTRDTIQIASAQSLIRRLDIYEFDLLIFDEGHLSAADILAPIINNNAFPVIGATYPKEYKQLIEPQSDFANAFEMIRVNEISEDERVIAGEQRQRNGAVGSKLAHRKHVLMIR